MTRPQSYQDAKTQALAIVETIALLPKTQHLFRESSVSVVQQQTPPRRFTFAHNADVTTKSIARKLNRASTNRAIIAAIASVIGRDLEPISPETAETRVLLDDVRDTVAEATDGQECITAITHLMPTRPSYTSTS